MSAWSDELATVLEDAGFTDVSVVPAPFPPYIVRLLVEGCDEEKWESLVEEYFTASTAQGNLGFLVSGDVIPAVDIKAAGVKIEEFRLHSADSPPPEWPLIFCTEEALRQLYLLMERQRGGGGKKARKKKKQ